jgi:uncharacterized linocin/CFP29 family protein
MALGREQVEWNDTVWNTLDAAVHDEFHRSAVALKFVPFHGQLDNAMTVPADVIDLDSMTVDEAGVSALVELGIDFGLTRQQTASEEQNETGVTLATRSANMLAMAEDLAIFMGDGAFKDPLFKRVRKRSGNAGTGLLASATDTVTVKAVAAGPPKRYGEATFAAVADAYARLQKRGHYGPYALALTTEIYADTFAPLASTLVMPADRIRALVELGLFGTGALPDSTGVMVSVGGNSMDLVVGIEPTTEFLQQDPDGFYRFRVFERFALRVKDRSAIVALKFE